MMGRRENADLQQCHGTSPVLVLKSSLYCFYNPKVESFPVPSKHSDTHALFLKSPNLWPAATTESETKTPCPPSPAPGQRPEPWGGGAGWWDRHCQLPTDLGSEDSTRPEPHPWDPAQRRQGRSMEPSKGQTERHTRARSHTQSRAPHWGLLICKVQK